MRDPVCAAPISTLPLDAAALLDKVRAQRPRVHCLTNAVAQAFTANALLAAGAIPSMTISVEEIGSFVEGAGALLVNLGTFDAARREAAGIAVARARAGGTPWVLDPVFIDRSPSRAAFARQLMAERPTALRLNGNEFTALAGAPPARERVVRAAADGGAVLALTGPVDLVTDGTRIADIANGHPFMGQVTAMGDALSALLAACLAVEPDAWRAASAAVLLFGVAGEVAATRAGGPGSFAPAFLDALHGLDAATLASKGRIA